MRRAALVLALGALGGCRAILGIDGASGGEADAPPGDGRGDGADGLAGFCYGHLLTVCLASAPTTTVTLAASRSIDTASDPLCQTPTNGLDACVIAGTSVTIASGAIVSAHGARPIVFLATGDLTIPGTIDVAGHGTLPGAAGNAAACASGTPPASGGGGAGGSFSSVGGDGGTAAGGAGGVHGAIQTATGLRGGCRGQDGSDLGPGAGGAGGGAVALIAVATIKLTGSVDASGAGGGGGTLQTGGAGGGGSGGTIIVDCQTLDTMFGAKAFANGGGGGEGAGLGGDGQAGADPDNLGPAIGGTGGSNPGGDGGNGFGATMAAEPGNPSINNAGAGGGGGGAGVIRATQVVSSIFSPPPS